MVAYGFSWHVTKQCNHWKSGVVIKMIRYFNFLTKVYLYLISPKALYLNLFYFKFICISGSFDCSVWYLLHVSKSFINWLMSFVILGQNTDSLARSKHLVSVSEMFLVLCFYHLSGDTLLCKRTVIFSFEL